MNHRTHSFVLALPTLVQAALAALAQAPGVVDLDDLQEQAIKAAIRKVAPSIVQIETSGGTEVITSSNPRGPQIRKGVGPTTGLIVAADGFVITSSFNFANKPQKIFVAVPGHKERYVAEVHATDFTRMLTLLKINATGLPVPTATPKKEFNIGQSTMALGRTLDPNPEHMPSVSVGIISAVNRIWGRAVQTDAKVSPANYGGPLTDLHGRVVGVMVPASPLSEDETAGVEWYDGGIGFAIPLEDINAVLPKLRAKIDLRKGLLGITPRDRDLYGPPPVVASVAPNSGAERAGIKVGDTILEIDNEKVVRQAQVMHLLGTKYDGDIVKVKVKHTDGKEEIFNEVKLSANLTSYAPPFLGILPMRDDPELGVEIRHVYEKSPAETAGLKVGDRITKYGVGTGALRGFNGQVSGRDELTNFVKSQRPNIDLKLEAKRKEGDKTETVTVKLGEIPNTVAERLPPESSRKQALAPRKTAGGPPAQPPKKDEKDEKKEPEVSFFRRSNAAQDHEYWMYVPDGGRYNPNISYALIIWLHPAGRGKERDMREIKSFWENYCDKHNFILVCPKAENDTGWVASETDFIREVAKEVMEQYTIDRRRVLVHGMGQGGEMGFYLAFHDRDLVRGVATTGAVLNNQVKAQVANQPLSFFLVAGDKDPVAPAVKDTHTKLVEQKYPVVYREIVNLGHQYLSDELADKTMEELVRWIDSLDRI